MNEDELNKLIRETKERATEILKKTGNCAYSPFIAMAEALDIPLTTELRGIPIGFAGGISGSGHICGALWASIAIIGIYQKRKIGDEEGENFFVKHLPIHMKAVEAYNRFIGMFESPNCKDLNPSFDLVSKEQLRKCTALVRKSIEITFQILFKE